MSENLSAREGKPEEWDTPGDDSEIDPEKQAPPDTFGVGTEECPVCGGSGKLPDGAMCSHCSGTGYLIRTITPPF